MNDIFYLSKENISMKIFADLFKKNINEINITYCSNEDLQVSYKQSIFSFFTMGIEEFKEESDLITIRGNDIKKIVCISLRFSDLNKLLELMKVILDAYGGILGNDYDGFYPLFTSKTLDLFKTSN